MMEQFGDGTNNQPELLRKERNSQEHCAVVWWQGKDKDRGEMVAKT